MFKALFFLLLTAGPALAVENPQALEVTLALPDKEFPQDIRKINSRAKVKNISSEEVRFEVMSCSYTDQFRMDSSTVTVKLDGSCDKNIPEKKSLKPGKIYEVELPLFIEKKLAVGSYPFRLAFQPRVQRSSRFGFNQDGSTKTVKIPVDASLLEGVFWSQEVILKIVP